MKLYSFTTVKDEEDIIESFVRYNMNILDGMVISDNNSSDSTLNILYKLKDEGYNIDIIEDKNNTFNQYKVKNDLLNYTKDKYKPDFIFPLDADEFIASNDKCNPRDIIKSLDKDNLYFYEMIDYIYEKGKESFIPARLTKVLANKKNKHYKTIISKNIYTKGIDLYLGSHDAGYINGEPINKVYLDSIYVAHYPVRSIEQYTNKAILTLNCLRYYSKESDVSYHRHYMLDKIIKKGKITENDLYKFSIAYTDDSINIKDYKIKNKKLKYSFCNKIKCIYTPKSNKLNILGNSLKLSEDIINEMRSEVINNSRTINELNNKIYEYRDRIEKDNEIINHQSEDYQKIINSRWWKLRKIFLFWKK